MSLSSTGYFQLQHPPTNGFNLHIVESEYLCMDLFLGIANNQGLMEMTLMMD